MIRWLPPRHLDLLYQLGISAANYKGFPAYRWRSIFVRGNVKDRLFVGDKVVVSRCRQEVWDELEGGGTKYSNCIYYCLKHIPLCWNLFP